MRAFLYYFWIVAAAIQFVAIYDGHTCWFTQLQWSILFHAGGLAAAASMAFRFRPLKGSNHLCWRCKDECDCDGLHMMTDCGACGRCK